MSQPEPPPNPEHKSNNAILCMGIGAGLLALSWFLGFGGVIAAASSGGNPALIAGGIGALIALALSGVIGSLLLAIGGVWMMLRVIADQRGERSERRYRDIQR